MKSWHALGVFLLFNTAAYAGEFSPLLNKSLKVSNVASSNDPFVTCVVSATMSQLLSEAELVAIQGSSIEDDSPAISTSARIRILVRSKATARPVYFRILVTSFDQQLGWQLIQDAPFSTHVSPVAHLQPAFTIDDLGSVDIQSCK